MGGEAKLPTEQDTALAIGQVLCVGDGVGAECATVLSNAARHWTAVASGAEALQRISKETVDRSGLDTVLVSHQLTDMSGLEFLRCLTDIAHDLMIVFGKDGGDLPDNQTLELVHLGVRAFVSSDMSVDETLALVALGSQAKSLERQFEELRRQSEVSAECAIVGRSPSTRRLLEVVRRVAENSTTILVEGRSGSGKSLLARAIHETGRRNTRPLVVEFCEGMSAQQLEEARDRANGSTLVLEDVQHLPAPTQARLVRHLKERSPRSAALDQPLDVRVIATTAVHLPENVARGQFREDLFYRLNVFPVQVPSLQERRDDIGLLAAHFLAQSSEQTGMPDNGLTAAAMILLETLPWPGNVAQLQSVIFRAHALAKGAMIERDHLLGPTTGLQMDQEPVETKASSRVVEDDDGNVREEDILPMETEEKRLLARALKATQGNVRRAAQLLRIGRATLYRKIQIYDLRLN